MSPSEDAIDYPVPYVSDTYSFSYPPYNRSEAKAFRAWLSGLSDQKVQDFDRHLEIAQSRQRIAIPPQRLCPVPTDYNTPCISERFYWKMSGKPSEDLVDTYLGIYMMNHETRMAFNEALAISVADPKNRGAENSGDNETEKGRAISEDTGGGLERLNTVESTRRETNGTGPMMSEVGKETGPWTTMSDVGKETGKWSRDEIEVIRKKKRRDELEIWEETCMGGINEEGYDPPSTICGRDGDDRTLEIRVRFPLEVENWSDRSR